MSEELPPVRCDDPSTWRHKDEVIDLPRLLQLIEENGGPENVDLHGADLSELDATSEALRPYVEAYAEKHGEDAEPPWLGPRPGGGIALHGAHLEHAFLIDAHFEDAVLIRAHLENAVLQGTHFENCSLLSGHLEEAFLRHAHLQDTGLALAHLEKANVSDAHLERADLRSAHLENADLRDAHLDSATWYSSHLDRTRLRREELAPAIGDELAARGRFRILGEFFGRFAHAREAYLALKTNFDSIGRYDDASWAYVKEQQMEKAMYFPTTAGHRWVTERIGGAFPPPWWGPAHLPRWLSWKLRSAFYHSRLFLGLCPRHVTEGRDEPGGRVVEPHERLSRWRWARNWAYELLTGYGERVYMPVVWAGVVILLFTLIYAVAGNIASGGGGGTHNVVTALTHSVGAFATIGFNTLEPVGWGARLLTAVEAMFGIGLFALFVFTLGNRMRRS